MTADDSSADAVRHEVQNVRLADSISRLSALASVRLPLEQLLTRVARYAVRAIPGADGAGLTLLEQDRADTIVATAEFVSVIDAIQYGMGEGPCIMAAREGRTVMSGSLGEDGRWGSFGGRIADLGVHSVVSLPLLHDDEVVGAMNVYAHAHDAFDERAAELGEAFAVPAAIAVQHAQVLAQTQRVAEQLQVSLDARMVVEQAVGVLVSRQGTSVDEARRQLEQLAAEQGVPLDEAARALVSDAAGRGAGGSPAAG